MKQRKEREIWKGMSGNADKEVVDFACGKSRHYNVIRHANNYWYEFVYDKRGQWPHMNFSISL